MHRLTMILFFVTTMLRAGCGGGGGGSDPIIASSSVARSFALSSASYTVSEATGSQTIAVNRTGTTGTVSVDCATTDDTAFAGEDYMATAGTLSFADGETSQQFSVTINEDTNVEDDEKFSVNLDNPTNGATLGSTASAEIIIIDNDSSSA